VIHDIVIMRTIVDIPEAQLNDLAQLSREEHISRAEAVRRAVAQYLGARKAAGAGNDAFGLWKDRKTDGLKHEDRVRREWQRP
jgi:hypothetical protein